MYKILLLASMMIGLFPAGAQSDDHRRCETGRIENSDQFEDWFYSKQMSASVLTTTYRVPVVVHILHTGEPVGEGFNYSMQRIKSQIRTLNEDFRRREGTPGFNAHADGADTQIEFVLAQIDPEGNPTDGVVRVDRTLVPAPAVNDIIVLCSQYTYWNPDRYVNIWCMDIGLHGIYTGKASFPVSDLEGLPNQPHDADGIFINAVNFGQGENSLPNLDMGRTLTHEMGHFLGLLHTFGPTADCSYSDYCADTPPLSSATYGCPSQKPFACDGLPAMIENYMDYSSDRCMNTFTKDQTTRMRLVLGNSPRRKSLLTSPVIHRDVVGIPDRTVVTVTIYPNPAADRLYISVDEKFRDFDVNLAVYTLLGQMIFEKTFRMTESILEIPVSTTHEKFVVVSVERTELSHRQLVMIK